MNAPHALLERLAAAVLSQTDAAAADATDAHLDDNVLAAFCLGTLTDESQRYAMAHLADCDACRRTVAILLRDTELDETPLVVGTELPRRNAAHYRAIVATIISLAASLLLVLTLRPDIFSRSDDSEAEYYAHAQQLLEQSDFAEADRLVAHAIERGFDSPRMHNLRAQALRRIPAASALAYAGRLSDFGFELGGVVRRNANPVADSTAVDREMAAADDDPTGVLNRGHLALASNQYGEAERIFSAFLEREPLNVEARLGLGLAQFMSDDFAAAEKSFSRILERSPENTVAAWNRAMTLEELGRFVDALAVWRQILPQLTDVADRSAVESHIQRLQRELLR